MDILRYIYNRTNLRLPFFSAIPRNSCKDRDSTPTFQVLHSRVPVILRSVHMVFFSYWNTLIWNTVRSINIAYLCGYLLQSKQTIRSGNDLKIGTGFKLRTESPNEPQQMSSLVLRGVALCNWCYILYAPTDILNQSINWIIIYIL